MPALVFLLALVVLTTVVWIRVLHRSDSATASEACPAPAAVVLPQPKSVSLTVLNSTQVNGLAHKVQAALVKDGFRVTDVANDETIIHGVGEIRYAPSGLRAAQLLSYYLSGAKLVPADLSGSAVVISLGAGFKGLTTPAVVQHDLAVAKVSQAPATPPKSSASASPTASVPASCTPTPAVSP